MADLQVPINRIARLIDYGQPCIVHPQLKNQNGGHYRSVGSTPNIRFNLHNIHGQSITSNKYKGGEGLLFQEGLRRVYGREYADYCDSLKVLYPSLNMSVEDIKEALVIARRIVRELEKEPRVYSTDERIELRNKYNKILNIYKLKL